MALEDARLGHRGREVERGLAAQPGEQPLGLLLGDDRLDRLDRQRLEVDDVGDRGVGHDRGRVRVDQDRPDALGAQRAAGLRPGVVELGRLADDDRPRAEDQDRRRLRAGRRQRRRAPRRRHGSHEPVEHRERVERPRRALGVVLDGLDRLLAVAQALDRAVVEVDLADPEPRRAGSESPTTWTSWFWAVTWTRPSSTSWTGWFAPWWPNRSRRRVGARGPADDLVTEADAEQRPAVVDDRLRQRDRGLESCRIARAGRQDQAVDVRSERRQRTRSCAGRCGPARRDGASRGRCST